MRLWGWLALVLATGCIGLTAMVARLLWLEEQPGEPRHSGAD
jgi:predicted MFS family arabinose efflux permease